MGVLTITLVALVMLGIAAPRFPRFRGEDDSCRPENGRRLPWEPGWQTRAVRDLSTAEDLLNLLEARGTAERELVIHGNTDFEVRWR